MHSLIFLLAYSALASATTYFLTVFAPDTEVDGALINAAGQGFYLSLDNPSTFCPESVKVCPKVEGTLVYAGLTGMAVQVPGGQQIYVSPSGQVQFTQAHSASMPAGAMVGGWYNKTVVSDCDAPHGVFDFLATDGSDAGGVKICPEIPAAVRETGAGYSVYVGTRGFNFTDCIDAVGLNLMPRDVDIGAWQYV